MNTATAKAKKVSPEERAAETRTLLVERLKAGEFFFQVGTMGEPGRREVQLYAKGHDGNVMLVGVPEFVLASWLLLEDPAAAGFQPVPDPERARKAFEPALTFQDLLRAAEKETTAAEVAEGIIPKPVREKPTVPGEDGTTKAPTGGQDRPREGEDPDQGENGTDAEGTKGKAPGGRKN